MRLVAVLLLVALGVEPARQLFRSFPCHSVIPCFRGEPTGDAAHPRCRGCAAPCDLKKLESAQWCEKCDKTLEKEAIKEGKCKACDVKVKKIEICVRPFFECACGGGD